MGVKTMPDIIDLMLDQAIEDGDNVHLCTQEPNDANEAAVTYQLATQAIVGANLVKANGDVSGRKVTISPAAGTNVDNTGTATHLAVTNGANTVLKFVATTVSQLLTSGNTTDIEPFDYESRALQES